MTITDALLAVLTEPITLICGGIALIGVGLTMLAHYARRL